MAENTITIPELPRLGALSSAVQLPAASGSTDGHITLEQLTDYTRRMLSPITNEERELLKNSLPDWHGTQAQYNALTSRDAGRWYVIEFDGDVVALYRGDQLITAVPNMVGEFTADSTEEDWYWWPNGVKTRIPVDPSTCKFSYYWPGTLSTGQKAFVDPTSGANDWRGVDNRLKRLERMPVIMGTYTQASVYYMLSVLVQLEQVPVIDCRNIQSIYYLCIQNQTPIQWERIAFKNTERVTSWEMAFNLGTQHKVKVVTGLDASALTKAINYPLGTAGAAYIEIKNLGKAAAGTSFDFRNINWGDDTRVRKARQSLVNSLVNWSFDRAAAGYAPATITLSPATFARLTSDEVAAINAKGFTIVTQ